MKGGQVQEWKRLDQVWGLVGDKPAFAAYLRSEIRHMLGDGKEGSRPASDSGEKPATVSLAPSDLPVPEPPADLPIPK
jgi:hypothetical protein